MGIGRDVLGADRGLQGGAQARRHGGLGDAQVAERDRAVRTPRDVDLEMALQERPELGLVLVRERDILVAPSPPLHPANIRDRTSSADAPTALPIVRRGVDGAWGTGNSIARWSRARRAASEIKGRVPDLKERVPEFGSAERVHARMPRSSRAAAPSCARKGTELRARGGELARQYAKMDVSWARCGYARALAKGCSEFVLGPMTDFYVRRAHGGTRGLR